MKRRTIPMPEPDHTKGVLDARRLYAQAWADATGRTIEEVEFTPELLRDGVTDLLMACIDARRAIASLDIEALGVAEDGPREWPVRDELLSVLDAAIEKAHGKE